MNPLDPEARTASASTRASPGESSCARRGLPFNLQPPEIPDYTLVKCIGQGGYGEVWLARNVLGTYYAVKIVYRQTFESDRPFEREFEGIQRFEPISRLHESQVTVLHVGRRTDHFYYVMELADDASLECGPLRAELPVSPASSSRVAPQLNTASYVPKTLRRELKRRGRLPFEECLQIALKLTEALGHLHQQGLVHRDVKPANVIFVNGRPKLADIGLVAGTEATLSFVGTEGYLPPEGPGKPPADIYSLGKVIYEISTGRDRNEYPELPSLWKSDQERDGFAELNEVILKACASDWQRRYSNTTSMHEDLVLIQAGKSLRRSLALQRRLQWAMRAAASLAVLAAIITAVYLLQRNQTRQKEIQVAQWQEKDGIRLMEEGDFIGSLPWFAEALARSQGDAEAERRHRFRIGEVLRRCPRLLQIIHEPGQVAVAEFSPEGRVITSGGLTNGQQYISEWSLPEGRLLQRIDTGINRAAPYAIRMTLSPDGRRVVAWTGNLTSHEAHLFDLRSAHPNGKALIHGGRIRWVHFSSDGLYILTASDDQTARIWKSASGELVRELELADGVLSAVMNVQGDRIVTQCANGMAYLWDARTGELLHTLAVGTKGDDVDCPPVFSSDGDRVIIQGRREVQIWDVRAGTKIRAFPVQDQAESLQFSPDGELVLTAFDKAQVWEAASGEAVTPALDKSLSYWTTAMFSPDGSHVISGSDAGVATIWDARSGTNVWPPLAANTGLSWFGNGVRFSPDGRMALVVSQGVHVWDMTSPQGEIATITHQGGLESLAFSPDGRRLVTASDDHTAKVWDAQTGRLIAPPLQHGDVVVKARFTPDGARVLTASYDGTAQLWDAQTGQKVMPALQHGDPIWKTEISRDGKWILTISQNRTGHLWDVATGRQAGGTIAHKGQMLEDAAFSPGSRKVISVAGEKARAWGLPSGEPLPWEPEERTYHGLEFSPDGRRALLFFSLGAQVLDAETFGPISSRFSHLGKRVWCGAWSPDGTKVVTSGEGNAAILWDANTGKQLVPAMIHSGGVTSLGFAANGRWILTISGNVVLGTNGNMVCLWDVNTGRLAAPPFKHFAPIRCAALSPDGGRLFVGSTDGTVRAWDLAAYEGSVEDLKEIAQVFSGRKVVGATIVEAVKPEMFKKTFDRLRGKYPAYFAVSTNDILSWHHREAEDRAHSRQLFAARWHLDRVKELAGDTAEFRQWREEVLGRGYPAPDTGASKQTINLTDFYTAPLAGPRVHQPFNGEVLHDCSPLVGFQTLRGVNFDIRGIVHLNGAGPAVRALGYPKSVRRIPILRPTTRLHFLQATTREASPGTKVGGYVVHYANGLREEIALVYGNNLSDFKGSALHLPKAALAWEDQRGRLFKFTWENPQPDQQIISLEFVSELTEAAPFLVALTAE